MDTDAHHPMILRSAGSSPSLRINRAFAEEFGLTSEDLAPGALLDWIHPDDKEALARQLDAGKGCVHARHQTKRGEWLAMEWRVRTHGGQAVALGLRCREPGVSTKLPEPRVPRQRVTLGGANRRGRILLVGTDHRDEQR